MGGQENLSYYFSRCSYRRSFAEEEQVPQLLQAALRGSSTWGVRIGVWLKKQVSGMAVYSWDCVCQALQKPFMQVWLIWFNALEKLGEVNAVSSSGKSSWDRL